MKTKKFDYRDLTTEDLGPVIEVVKRELGDQSWTRITNQVGGSFINILTYVWDTYEPLHPGATYAIGQAVFDLIDETHDARKFEVYVHGESEEDVDPVEADRQQQIKDFWADTNPEEIPPLEPKGPPIMKAWDDMFSRYKKVKARNPDPEEVLDSVMDNGDITTSNSDRILTSFQKAKIKEVATAKTTGTPLERAMKKFHQELYDIINSPIDLSNNDSVL